MHFRNSGKPKIAQAVLLLALAIGSIAPLPACRHTSQSEDLLAVEPIEEALRAFLHEHAHDPALAGLGLDERSLAGRVLREREDLLFLGDWSVQRTPGGLTALWSRELGPDESVRVRVELQTLQTGYRVRDWDVEETF